MRISVEMLSSTLTWLVGCTVPTFLRIALFFFTVAAQPFNGAAFAREVRLEIVAFETPAIDDLSIALFIETGLDQIDRQPSYTIRLDFKIEGPRNSGTVSKQFNKVFLPDSSKVLAARALAFSSSGDMVGATPLILFRLKDDDSTKVVLRDENFKFRSSEALAFSESYPFYESGTPAKVGSDDLVPAVQSLRYLITPHSALKTPSEDQWKEVYLVLSKNTQLVMSRSEKVLPWILRLLSDFNRRNIDAGFSNFYLQFLHKSIEGDFGGVTLEGGETLASFALRELKGVYEQDISRTYRSIDQTANAYFNARDYEKCLTITAFAATQLHNSIMGDPAGWKSTGARTVSNEIKSLLHVGWQCAELLYSTEQISVNGRIRFGNPNDAEMVFDHLTTFEFGKDFIVSFQDLVAASEFLGRRALSPTVIKYYSILEQD